MTHKTILLSMILAVISILTLGHQTLVKAIDGGRRDMSQSQIQAVIDKKIEIQQKLTLIKETRVAKLESKRLEICQQRQQKINDIALQGVEQNTKQLAVFQKIEANVRQFYINNKLSSDNYLAVSILADAAEAGVVAALEVSVDTTFDCESANSSNPGGVIKESMTTRHSTLDTYRKAIKDLIEVVKKSNNAEGQQ